MKSVNQLILDISRIIEIALEECCLSPAQTYYDSICDYLVVHYVSQFTTNGKSKKIEIDIKVPDKPKRKWDRKVEIWTTHEAGLIEFKTTKLTKLIDCLTKIKKKASS